MIKTLRYVFASLMVLLCGSAMAEEVTLNFNDDIATLFPTFTSYSSGSGQTYVADGEFNEETTSAAVGGVTVTVTASAADASNRNRLWATNPRLRLYDGTITFTSAGENITKIELTRTTNKGLVANDNTADSGTLTTSDQQSNGVVTWTGDAKSVTITIAGNTQLSKAVVTLGGEPGQVDPEPEKKMNRIYKKVSAVESGKAYLMVADGKAAQVLTSNYGYLKVDDVKDENGEISRPQDNTNEFVFESTGDGYTIKQADGRYLYQTGTYNSFNVNAEPTDGQIWTVAPQEGGTFKITNQSVNKYIQYSSSHTSYGSYADEQGVLPALYVFDREEEAGNDPVEIETKAADIKVFAGLANDTEVELTLTNAQVIYKNVNGSNVEIFIRDASGAMDFYNMGIEAKVGQLINGTIIGKRGANGGFNIAMKKSDNTNVSTVTVSGSEQDVEAEDIGLDVAADYYCNYVVLKNVSISADGKKASDGETELALYDRFKLNLLSGLNTDKTYDIYGLMYDGGTSYGPELVVTKVTLAGGGEIVDDPATPVESVGSLLSMENTSNIELTLTDAKVLFNDGNYIYVRENGKAICFYQVAAVKELFKNNAVVSGKICVDYEVYKNMPEVKANKNTAADGLTIVESEEEADVISTTAADVAAGKNICDLVTLKGILLKEVTYKEDGETVQSTTYYVEDGDAKLLVVNNGKNLNKIETGNEITITGVCNTNSSGDYQVKLIKNAIDSTEAIDELTTDVQKNASIYNLNGQRVEKAQKGLYIIGGKKVMMK